MIVSVLQNIKIEEGSLLLINKPLRWTSFDVINKLKYEIRKYTPQKKFKIGHAGTLDPLASGLLIVCVGNLTKKINDFQNLNKRYTATFTLGAVTRSYDLEHPPENFRSYENIRLEDIEKTCKQLTGALLQIPPIYSAIKVQGKSAFEYARKDREIQLTPKEITVFSFDILCFNPPDVEVNICCSKGTYIRSLARDLGELLGCGAYIKALHRTHIGSFSVDDAYDINPLISETKSFEKSYKKKNFEL
ncbi:MAG: tRNA pseudouridine(55) synthase TruB [Bacteroidales bacterium]|nr:tRNA pseudouridine(55) synthase TruB [Bacteroidales bacterium]MDD4208785.1 tRNA pseudouridine(55) synthase TruB [Bacteroidales bacterium]